jgi:altronate hydrolase
MAPCGLSLSTSTKSLQRPEVSIIDIDTGSILSEETSVEQTGEKILDTVIRIASGEAKTKAELLAQGDFIPWKRGVSL